VYRPWLVVTVYFTECFSEHIYLFDVGLSLKSWHWS